MLTYFFPGQGSQARGMGVELFNDFPELVSQADDILGYSIRELCQDNPDHRLGQTQYTQPALYIVNALSYFKKINENNVKPDYVCGHSLGEYNALLAANVFDFATGLTLVKKRGELMSHAKNGGMAAIIGLNTEDVEDVLRRHDLNNVTIANFNTYKQHVISGPNQEIENAKVIFSKLLDVMFIQLAVSGAFHSPYMTTAKQQFSDYLAPFEFNIPTIPVIANVDASPYHPIIIKHNLSTQITHPVKWTAIIEYLLQYEDMTFEEIGPGRVLGGLLRNIKAEVMK